MAQNSETIRPRKSVAEEIRLHFDRLTPTERKPAQTLLANYPIAGLETVARFADRAGVSGPTILRLIAKLGFSGYAEFQRVLRDELQAQLESPLTRQPPTEGHGQPRKKNFLNQFGEAVIDNIRQTLEAIHASEFDAVVDLLTDDRKPVNLIGGRFSSSVASYLYQHLHTLRPSVNLISGPQSGWRNHLLDTGRRHVVLVFDIRRYQSDVIRFAEESARRGATVVLFTDQWLSPVSGVARHVLSARVTAPSSWDSSAAMFVISEALISRVSEKLWPSVKARIEEMDRMLNRPSGAERN